MHADIQTESSPCILRSVMVTDALVHLSDSHAKNTLVCVFCLLMDGDATCEAECHMSYWLETERAARILPTARSRAVYLQPNKTFAFTDCHSCWRRWQIGEPLALYQYVNKWMMHEQRSAGWTCQHVFSTGATCRCVCAMLVLASIFHLSAADDWQVLYQGTRRIHRKL